MTKTTTKYGMFGVDTIVAILTVSLIVANVAQDADAVSLPAKKGYTGGANYAAVSEEEARDGTDSGLESIINEFYFKTNSGGDIVWDLTLECATATHVQGKSSKKNQWEGALVDGNVWFEVKYAGESEWKTIPFKGEAGDLRDAHDGVWNLCSQTFEIKTNLNDLIVQDTNDSDGDGDTTELRFACDGETDTDGDGIPDLTDPDQIAECQQFIDLFLENAGTHPAKAVLKNVPNGVHEGRVMAEVIVESQNGLVLDTGADGDELRQTMLTFGNRLLILEDIQIIEAHDQQ